ncbi:MAG: SH3 domain-containing protein [Hyphomicrobiaceae bacterium]
MAGLLSILMSAAALAAADGPDAWDVVHVVPPDVLNVHAEASARSAVIAGIPAETRGLKNLGCTGTPTFQQWMAMSAAERERSSRARWCRISYAGTRGWVSGRFLAEGSSAAPVPRRTAVGPWAISCQDGGCVIEQAGLGGLRPTRLRIEPKGVQNAEITIQRGGLPRQGVLTVHMDGKLISSGPVAPLRSADGRELKMTPDDITAGLLREMGRHRTMVLTVPGEAGGIEFHLERFGEALTTGQGSAR